MAITLTAAQLQDMQTRFKLDTNDANYAGMYQYIFEQVGSQTKEGVRSWLRLGNVANSSG